MADEDIQQEEISIPEFSHSLITHPLDGSLDLTTSTGIKLFNKAGEIDPSQPRLELTVANNKKVIAAIKQRAMACRMTKFLRFPTNGSGVPHVRTTRTNGTTIIEQNAFDGWVKILDNHQDISLEQMTAYAQYNWGGNNSMRSFSMPLKIGPIDLSQIDDGIDHSAEVARLQAKQQYRIRAEMMHSMLMALAKPEHYQLLLAEEEKFTFESDDGELKIDGFLMLKIIFMDIKPEVVIDVRDKEQELESIKLSDCDNNVQSMTRKMETTWKEINKEKPGTYDNTRFLREVFRALNTAKNDDFKQSLKPLKNQWILNPNAVTPVEVIQAANSFYKNIESEGSWSKVSEAETKVIALTAMVEKTKKEFIALQSKVAASKMTDNKDNKSQSTGAKIDWEKQKEWRCKKVGATLSKDGCKWVWCTEEHNGGKGMYMPEGHIHAEWKKSREEKKNKKRKAKDGKKDKKGKDGEKQKKTDENTNSGEGKLELAKSLTTALTTKVGVSDADAKRLAEEILGSGKA